MIGNGEGCTIGISLKGAGAITVHDPEGLLWVWDLPAEPETAAWLLGCVRHARVAFIDAGAATETRDLIKDILTGFRVPVKLIRRKLPDDSRSIAARHWPAQAELFSSVDHAPRAEAALLAGEWPNGRYCLPDFIVWECQHERAPQV